MNTNAPEYVVNELLMYVCSKLNSDTVDDVTKAVDDFYGDEAVTDAKEILWTHYGVLAVLGRNVSRRTKYKHVEDIVDALRTVDTTYPDKLQMPTIFVARSMFNLPTISQSPSTVPSNHSCPLENRVHILESQMVEIIKAAMPSTGSSSRNDHVSAIIKVPTDNKQDTTSGGDGNSNNFHILKHLVMNNRSKLLLHNTNNTIDNTRDLLDSNEHFSPGLVMMMKDGRLCLN